MHKVFISKIPEYVSTNDIEYILQKHNINYQNDNLLIFRKRQQNVNHNTQLLGHMILCFQTQEEANNCIKTIDNLTMNGYKKEIHLSVGNYIPDFKKQTNNTDNSIYVTNLPNEIKESDLFDLFSELGDVLSTKIMKKRDYSNNQIGFVLFSNPQDARRAIELGNQKYLGSNMIYVQPYKSASQRISENKDVLIQGLPQNVTSIFIINLLINLLNKPEKEIFNGIITVQLPKVRKAYNEINAQAIFTCVSSEIAREVVTAINNDQKGFKAMLKLSKNMRDKIKYQETIPKKTQKIQLRQEPQIENDDSEPHRQRHRKRRHKHDRFE